MEIATVKDDFLNQDQAITELERLLLAINAPLNQPCPNCEHPANAGKPDLCHWQCAGALEGLSTAPDLHPIEPHMANITFELSKLSVFQTCWSCEGHLDPQGNLYRQPQLIFYCASPTYVLLFHEYLDSLHYGGHLHTRWQIALTSLGQKMGVTYVLEPAFQEDRKAPLHKLQEDLLVIGTSLVRSLSLICEEKLARLKVDRVEVPMTHCQRL